MFHGGGISGVGSHQYIHNTPADYRYGFERSLGYTLYSELNSSSLAIIPLLFPQGRCNVLSALSLSTWSPRQTISTLQRDISRDFCAQHVAHIWPSCCDVLVVVGSNLTIFKLEQQHPTCRNTSQQGCQMCATCCTQQCCDMLRRNVEIVGGSLPGLFKAVFSQNLFALVLHSFANDFCVLKKLRYFVLLFEVKPKPVVTYLRTISLPTPQRHVFFFFFFFRAQLDWFTPSLVIYQDDHFCFRYTTRSWTPLYPQGRYNLLLSNLTLKGVLRYEPTQIQYL